MLTVALLMLVFGPICLYAYGTRIQEMIFLNQVPGATQFFVNISFSIVMIYNCVLTLVTMIDVIFNRTVQKKPNFFNNQFTIRMMAILPCLMFSLYFEHITLFFNINSICCANMMQIILPNCMVLMINQELGMDRPKQKIISWILILLGVFVTFWGLIDL